MTEQPRRTKLVRQIMHVFYAPHKAFREIAENPKYLGPVLIMIIFGAIFSLTAYTYLSRVYVEQTVPPTASNGDQWIQNSTLWASNAVINESSDHISGGFYGNESMDFSTLNDAQIWMLLSNIGPVNCTGSDGYKNMSFRVKPIYPANTEVANVSLYLYSSQADYFYHDLTAPLLSTNDTWSNFTIPLGVASGWSNNGTSADWSNITGLKFEFDWTKNASLTVRVVGLFFRGFFESPLGNVTSTISTYFVRGLWQFIIRWFIVATFIYLLTRWFGSTGTWKLVMALTGFALIPMVIQAVLNMLAFSTLPTLYYSFEFIAGASGEAQTIAIAQQVAATEALASQILMFAEIIAYVWIVALLTTMIHVSTKLSWFKGFIAAAVAFFTSLLLEGFLAF